MNHDPLDDSPVYVISVVAQLTGLHAQTLRQYDRLGLVAPQRTPGGGRRYSLRDMSRLRQVQQLSSEGVGLEGIRQILDLQRTVAGLQQRVDELEGDLERAYLLLRHVGTAPPQGTELVVRNRSTLVHRHAPFD
ncbi:MAG: MerR family transcriptional regulator [Actinomycetes bacterium]